MMANEQYKHIHIYKTVSRKKTEMNRQTRNKARLVLIYKTTQGPHLDEGGACGLADGNDLC